VCVCMCGLKDRIGKEKDREQRGAKVGERTLRVGSRPLT